MARFRAIEKMNNYNLKPFFEDTTTELSIRDYSKLQKIGRTKATRILKDYTKENVLMRTKAGPRSPYKLNAKNSKAKSLSQLYWQNKLSSLISKIKEKTNSKGIILVNEFPELTNTKETKIVLFLIESSTNKINLKEEKEKLGREIKLIECPKLSRMSSSSRLLVANGHLLYGQII